MFELEFQTFAYLTAMQDSLSEQESQGYFLKNEIKVDNSLIHISGYLSFWNNFQGWALEKMDEDKWEQEKEESTLGLGN